MWNSPASSHLFISYSPRYPLRGAWEVTFRAITRKVSSSNTTTGLIFALDGSSSKATSAIHTSHLTNSAQLLIDVILGIIPFRRQYRASVRIQATDDRHAPVRSGFVVQGWGEWHSLLPQGLFQERVDGRGCAEPQFAKQCIAFLLEFRIHPDRYASFFHIGYIVAHVYNNC